MMMIQRKTSHLHHVTNGWSSIDSGLEAGLTNLLLASFGRLGRKGFFCSMTRQFLRIRGGSLIRFFRPTQSFGFFATTTTKASASCAGAASKQKKEP